MPTHLNTAFVPLLLFAPPVQTGVGGFGGGGFGGGAGGGGDTSPSNSFFHFSGSSQPSLSVLRPESEPHGNAYGQL